MLGWHRIVRALAVLASVFLIVILGTLGVEGAQPSLRDAVKLYRKQMFPDAEKVLTAVLAKSPDSMAARLLMGWVLWNEERWDAALLRFKSVLHDAPAKRLATSEERIAFDLPTEILYIDDPDLSEARDGLAWTYFKKGWVRLAHQQFSELNGRYPRWDGPYLGLGYTLLAQRKFKASRQAFTAFLDRTAAGSRKPEEGERGLGELLSAEGESSRAIPHFERALRERRGWLDVKALLAWNLLRAGRLQQADRAFAELPPARRLEADAGRAWVALRQDRLDAAAAAFSAILHVSPAYAPAVEGSRELRRVRYKPFDDAWALYDAGKYPEAASAFQALDANLGRMPSTMKPFVTNGLAWSKLAVGDVDSAKKLFQASLRELPHGADATAGLGWVAIRRKEWSEAERDLAEAGRAAPALRSVTNGLAALRAARFGPYDRAWKLYWDGKYAEASAAFAAVVKNPADLPPDTVALAQAGVAWSDLALGRTESAERLFKEIKPKSRTDEADVNSGLGWVLVRRHQPAAARKLFDEALATVPQYAPALRGLGELRRTLAPALDEGWAAYRAGKATEAEALFSRVVTDETLPAEYRREARRGRAWSLLAENKPEQAATEFDGLLHAGEDADLLYGRGLARSRLGEHRLAVADLERVVALVPASADYRVGLGWALLAGGRAQDALQSFLAAYRLAPASGEVNRGLGWAYEKTNRVAEAKAAFRYAASVVPGALDDKDFRTLTASGQWQDLRGDLAWGYARWQAYEPARAIFEALTKTDAGDGDAWFGAGYMMYKLGRNAEADALLERAIRARRPALARLVWVVFPGKGAFPIFADARSILGWTALVGGRCDRAISRFDASLDRDPEMVASLAGKAQCLQRTGHVPEARELFLTAWEIYPTYPTVLTGLADTGGVPKRP